MKKIISTLLALLLLTCASVSAQNPITVEVNKTEVPFDAPPVNVNGRILVPVRAIFEAMGATVTWNAQTQTVSSRLDGSVVVMTIGQNIMKVNGERVALDVPPQIMSDRTMVPARAAAEALDARVLWNPSENKVSITTEAFSDNLKNIKHHRSEKTLSYLEDTTRESMFDFSYFPSYETKTDAPDGTDFEVVASSDAYCGILGIRSDIYIGTETQLSKEYAQHIAEDMVTLTGGTLISADVVYIGDTQFMKIRYTAPGSAENIYDETADITTYMAFSDGVVYTVTMSLFGDVPFYILSDFNYMLNTITIK